MSVRHIMLNRVLTTPENERAQKFFDGGRDDGWRPDFLRGLVDWWEGDLDRLAYRKRVKTMACKRTRDRGICEGLKVCEPKKCTTCPNRAVWVAHRVHEIFLCAKCADFLKMRDLEHLPTV